MGLLITYTLDELNVRAKNFIAEHIGKVPENERRMNHTGDIEVVAYALFDKGTQIDKEILDEIKGYALRAQLLTVDEEDLIAVLTSAKGIRTVCPVGGAMTFVGDDASFILANIDNILIAYTSDLNTPLPIGDD